MREFLKALGLEQEAIDTIMAEHGKLMTANTEKITQLTTEINDLKAETTELKKVDGAALQKKIDELTAENTKLATDHTNEVNSLKFDSALQMAITKANTVDPIALKAHLDASKMKYNEETKDIEGFEEQLTSIKESHKYLFNGAQSTGGFQGGLTPPAGSTQVNLKDALVERYNNN